MLIAAASLLLQVAMVDTTVRHAPVARANSPITAERVAQAPTVDGRLDEPIWATVAPVTTLYQREPTEGAPVSERTEVRFLYDAAALYVGVRLFDRDPHGIVSRLGRRDAVTHSDEFRLFLDSYHDRLTAFEFIVNPAGVKHDLLVGDDGAYEDDSWDPVWEVATSVDSLGWTAELRIPFSQLRFAPAQTQVWGVCVQRWIQRKNELAAFPLVPKTLKGVASRCTDLVGLHDVTAPRHVEVMPYAVGRGSYDRPATAGNPYDDGSRYFGGLGGDVRYGITSNLTLDGTVNPDFGQVEVDPAFVNLTAYEQFLEEHRPFFVEGRDVFTFGGTGGGMTLFGDPTPTFYSRRIGRPPEAGAPTSGPFVDMPDKTTILGAAKLAEKRAGGWSVGMLDAVTSREWASVADSNGALQSRDEVEPPTNYYVGRVRRELDGGNTAFGVLGTAVNRRLDTPALDVLRRSAYVGGADFYHRWGRGTYSVAVSVTGSRIDGDTLAIQLAQRSSDRYYQRPDAHSFQYDRSRTALTGVHSNVQLNKLSGNWTGTLTNVINSPGYEINDLGFQNRVDQILTGAAVQRRWTRPGPVFRNGLVSLALRQGWNFDGDPIAQNATTYAYGQFHNFWSVVFNAGVWPSVIDDRLTRGGPLARTPASSRADLQIYSDSRKQMSAYVYLGYGRDAAGGWEVKFEPLLTLRRGSALWASVGPGYAVGRVAAQFVDSVADPTAAATLGRRYVFSQLLQHTLDMDVRVNAAFSPVLSVQLFVNPFAFSGDYQTFKELRAPRTFTFNQYGRDNGSTITRSGNSYTVDPDGAGPAPAFSFADPAFRTRSLQLNAVLRWEYHPGSTMYVVWTQRRSGLFASDGTFDLGRALGRDLLADRPTNVLLVKLSYWMSL